MIGVIITSRDRVKTVRLVLDCLHTQTRSPAWVCISNLGSRRSNSRILRTLAEQRNASYIHIDYKGVWNKGLAFNTALRRMPEASKVLQLDADVLLGAHCLERMEEGEKKAWVVVPNNTQLSVGAQSYELLGKGSTPRERWAVGCAAYPRDWLLWSRGIDEEFEGWGNQDMELLGRAENCSNGMVSSVERLIGKRWGLHIDHAPTETYKDMKNRDRNLARRVEQNRKKVQRVNPDGFGEGVVVEETHRTWAPPNKIWPAAARR